MKVQKKVIPQQPITVVTEEKTSDEVRFTRQAMRFMARAAVSKEVQEAANRYLDSTQDGAGPVENIKELFK